MKKFTELGVDKDVIASALLFMAVIVALIISNIDHTLNYYREFISIKLYFGIEEYQLNKPLLKWVNDGLMAIFFFLLGLEMKYHMIHGEFASRRNLVLPSLAAAGGFIVPALVYFAVNLNYPQGQAGWAIPVATDTAFVLAIISFFGKKIPDSLKVFVIGLSIIDDVLAVIVLALFYTPNFDAFKLLYCTIPLLALALMNISQVSKKRMYYIGFFALWVITVNSGVHGTIAGVVAALLIPTQVTRGERNIMLLKKIQSSTHDMIAFFVLPLFAFVNCELPFNELNTQDFVSPVAIGCLLGLLVGKPLGIILFSVVPIMMRYCHLPQNVSKGMYVGISFLCGIGFTLSLFIGLQAFGSEAMENQMKIGVLAASILAALIGSIIIRQSLKVGL